MKVFCSLLPDQIDLTRAKAKGVTDLKHFLSYAHNGIRALAREVSTPRGNFDSFFEEAVAKALSRRGWTVHAQVGVSGFRVDLGVVDPDQPGRYLAGVECDGASYHRAATAQDRDRLREGVLRSLGWEIVHIWSTDCWHNAENALNKLDDKLKDILLNARSKKAGWEEKILIAEQTLPQAFSGQLRDAGDAVSIPVALEDAKALVIEPTSQIIYAARTDKAQAVKQLAQTDGITTELLSDGRNACLTTAQNEKGIAAALDERWDKGKPARQKQGSEGHSVASYQHVENSKNSMDDAIVTNALETEGNCEKRGSPMQTKKGKFGLFLACTAYPKCMNTKSLEGGGANAGSEPQPAEPLDEKCSKCVRDLAIKTTRVGGRFIACTGYPKCRYARGLPVGVACPDCGGDIVEKTSLKRNKLFFGCSNYPNCNFTLWDRPLNATYPKCGYPFLLEKTTHQGTTMRCPVRSCGY